MSSSSYLIELFNPGCWTQNRVRHCIEPSEGLSAGLYFTSIMLLPMAFVKKKKFFLLSFLCFSLLSFNLFKVHDYFFFPNDEYDNFVNTYLEAAAKYIPTKQRTKSRVPCETLAVREKCADVKTASKCNRKDPTNTNALKLKKHKMN